MQKEEFSPTVGQSILWYSGAVERYVLVLSTSGWLVEHAQKEEEENTSGNTSVRGSSIGWPFVSGFPFTVTEKLRTNFSQIMKVLYLKKTEKSEKELRVKILHAREHREGGCSKEEVSRADAEEKPGDGDWVRMSHWI